GADTDFGSPGFQALPGFDLDGNPRFADDPNTPDTGQGTPPIVDMGAYEGPNQGFIIDPDVISVPEGGTGAFTVALAADPLGTVTVSVARVAGDPDIVIQDGALLAFDSENFTIPQTVTLFAIDDVDFTNDETIIRLETPGLPPAAILALEADDEPVPAVVYVDKQAVGADSGLSWADAFTEVRDALRAVANRPGVSEVWAAAGTYTPAGPGGDRRASFNLVQGVSIYGGFSGGETVREESYPAGNATILSGDLNGDDGPDWEWNAENSYHVVTATGLELSVVLDGFTVSGGNANGILSTDKCGGGMYNRYASPTLSRCTFRNNTGDYGGGLYNQTGLAMKLAYCDFIANNAEDKGGGVYNGDFTPEATFTNCRFAGNTGTIGGGMANEVDAAPTLINCLFTGNVARYEGGGFDNDDNAMHPRLINCTFSGNTALGPFSRRVGGIRNHAYQELILTNCILWGNSNWYGTGERAQLSGPAFLNYSCVQGWTDSLGGTGNLGDDPLFVRSPDDGGDGWGVGGNDDYGDLHLLPGSPCIDAGDNAAVPADTTDLDEDGDTDEPVPFDLDGDVRFMDDPGTSDTGDGVPPIVDMGAYEFLPASLDVKPGSCPNSFNRKSRGALHTAVCGTETFDVTTIDIASVRLCRVDGIGGQVAPHEGPPGPHSVFDDVATPYYGESCHELGADGIVDLQMHFENEVVTAVLELDALAPGAMVELVINGSLLDGRPFTTEADRIRLVPPGTPPGLAAVSSTVCEVWIDAYPLDLQLDGGGFANFERSYPQTSLVTLTAPRMADGRRFVRWEVNGQPQTDGERSLGFEVVRDVMEVTAVYRNPVVEQGQAGGAEEVSTEPIGGAMQPQGR
ncbi:MAG: hypothetical protein JSV19_10015, partial [Phycisphaerales bacterium]